ncbi:MAG TPA: hypothetical protein VGL35_03125 [Rhizomicrobium sp.]
MIVPRALAALLFAGLGALPAVAAPAPAGAPARTQTGPSYSFTCSDLSKAIVRANGGAAMRDFMLEAGSACLARGSTITIRNADRSGWLYLYGTLIEAPGGVRHGYNNKGRFVTVVEGGVPLGGGCAVCLSVAFIAPGTTKTFVYDAATTIYPSATPGLVRGAPPAWTMRAQSWRLIPGEEGTAPATRLPRATGNIPAIGGFAPAVALPLQTPRRAWKNVPDETVGRNVLFWGEPWEPHEDVARPWAIRRATGKDGSDIARLELRNGDHWADEARQGRWYNERSLLQSVRKLSNDIVYWEAYRFLFECGAAVGSDDFARGSYWLLLENIHSDNRPGYVVPIQTELLPGGFFALDIRTMGGPSQHYAYIAPVPLACGVWHKVVRAFELDPNGGFVNQWLDGDEIVQFKGPIGNPDDRAYPVFELYRANYYGKANTYAEEIAGYRFGTESLRDLITPPAR